MEEFRFGGHTVHIIRYHFVWVTAWKLPLLRGPVKERMKKILVKCAEDMRVQIVGGKLSTYYAHLLVAGRADIKPSDMVKSFKGTSTSRIYEAFPELRKMTGSGRVWTRGYMCITDGSLSQEVIDRYVAGNINATDVGCFEDDAEE